MLHLPTTDLTRIRFYREAYREGEECGEKRGEKRGEERGEKRGEKRGERRLIQRQLHRRFGPLPTAQEAALNILETEALEALGEALLEFSSLADLDAWLAARG